MPFAEPGIPNLAIEKLAARLRKRGESCDVLYGTLLFHPLQPEGLHHFGIAPATFAGEYWEIPDDQILAEAASLFSLKEDSAARRVEELLAGLKSGMVSARRCLDQCARVVDGSGYDLIGLSIGFDAQRLPSMALAKRLKRAQPGLRILAGGTACDGPMGPALLRLFPEIDAVLQGEADSQIGRCVDVMVRRADRDSLAGFWSRDEHGYPRSSNHPEVQPDLAIADAPANFDSYFEQRANSPYATRGVRTVMYEASRGCWWGIKHHCTFCGIRAVDHPYRQVNAHQVVLEILSLQKRHEPDLVYFTDAILSRAAFTSFIPELARLRREGRLSCRFFAETKSNLRADEIGLLAEANFTSIQPGIETFLSSTLRRMKKGATGIQHIALLKWCQAFGVTPAYGLLVGTPGETPDDLWTLADICRSLVHLPPPADMNNLSIHRFSPYFDSPDEHGLSHIGPTDYQRLLYRCDDNMLMQLCYEFRYAYSDQTRREERAKAVTAVGEAVNRWAAGYSAGARLLYAKRPKSGTLFTTSLETTYISQISGVGARIMDLAEHCISRTSLFQALRDVSESRVESAIDELVDRECLIELDGRLLNIAVPANPWLEIRRTPAPIPICADKRACISVRN